MIFCFTGSELDQIFGMKIWINAFFVFLFRPIVLYSCTIWLEMWPIWVIFHFLWTWKLFYWKLFSKGVLLQENMLCDDQQTESGDVWRQSHSASGLGCHTEASRWNSHGGQRTSLHEYMTDCDVCRWVCSGLWTPQPNVQIQACLYICSWQSDLNVLYSV